MSVANTVVVALLLAGLAPVWGQIPKQRRADRPVLLDQARDLYSALRPVVELASESAVEVRVWRKRVGYGTAVGKTRVLTKWSEVRADVRSLSCRTGDGRWLPAKVVGIYRDADLVVLQVDDLNAKPAIFGKEENLDLGSFLVMARPDGEAGGMGVVSVLPRSLRVADQGFLGISMSLRYQGEGVKVDAVEEGSGAEKAGLQPGDLILAINGREANGSFELRSALQRVSPGEDVTVKFRRADREFEKVTQLGSRPSPRRISADRMAHMNALGGHRYNEVRESFSNVIQSDMQIGPEDCGAPVVGLDGTVVGITIARAGRIKSYIIPTSAILDLLGEEPSQPTKQELARTGSRDSRAMRRYLRARGENDSPEAIRRHLDELRRLMEEMESMEP